MNKPAVPVAPGILAVPIFAPGEAALIAAFLSLATAWRPAGINAEQIVDRRVRDAEILDAEAQPALLHRVRERVAIATVDLAAQLAPAAVLAELQLVRYRTGGTYVEHRDRPACDAAPRSLSIVGYLNDDFTGGATVFPELSVTVRPQAGKAIVFAPDLLHRADPILQGCKYAITAWYHTIR